MTDHPRERLESINAEIDAMAFDFSNAGLDQLQARRERLDVLKAELLVILAEMEPSRAGRIRENVRPGYMSF